MRHRGIHAQRGLAALLVALLLLAGSFTSGTRPIRAFPPEDSLSASTSPPPSGLNLELLGPAVPQPQRAPNRPSAPAAPVPGAQDGHARGFVPPPMDLSHLKGRLSPSSLLVAAPTEFDWRTLGKVTPVKDQGPCGVCYAFASVANFESKVLIDKNLSADFSENNVKECLNGSGGCSGGNYLAVADLFSQKGAVLESCDPYVAADVPCKTTCPYQKTLLDWRMISDDAVPSTDVLKNYIQTYGPIYTAMYASFPGFSNYDGSSTLYYAGTEPPDHAVLIVGWDDDLAYTAADGTIGHGAWIVKNSWGTNWGGTAGYGTEKGYFTIAYGSASIGKFSSFLYAWQDYDTNGGIMYYDDAGWNATWGYGITTAWALVRFTPISNTYATRVEFWTTDSPATVDVYIYDSFDGTATSGLLASKLNVKYEEAGYHSLALDTPVTLTTGDDVFAVVKFTNTTDGYPAAADSTSPTETQRTYVSYSGAAGSWTDLGSYGSDLAIRLRTSNAVVLNPPAVPNGLFAVVASQSQINLYWNDNADNETGFKVERSPDGIGNWTTVYTTTANVTSYQDKNLTCGTTYYYRVRAYNTAGEANYSTTVSAATQACPGPNAPSNLTATAVSQTEIDLTWQDNSADESDFRIERSADGIYWTEIGTVPAGVTSFSSGGLTCGTRYSYRVRAHRQNDGQYSDFSNMANAMTVVCTPAAPSSLSAVASSQTGISLTWTDNATNESGFKVERSPSGTSGWTELATLAANQNTYSDTGLHCGTDYSYRVRAYNSGGESAFSNIASATTAGCSAAGIDGSVQGVIETTYAFTTTVSPISATWPVTYSWQGTEQDPVVHANLSILTDSVRFTWEAPGTKTIMVTVSSATGTATATWWIVIEASLPPGVKVYLPLAVRSAAR